MSATEGSIDSPWAVARRRARKTSLGSRARWTSSLKVSEPNSSVALRWVVDAAFLTDMPKSLMLRIASPDAADPMADVPPMQRDHYGRGAGRAQGESQESAPIYLMM